jgi:phage-related protein
MDDPLLRPLVFVGASRKEFMRFPRVVVRDIGFRLFAVQAGRQPDGEKPLVRGSLKGLGIRELRDDFDRDTYRVVYTVRLTSAVYVLHAFKKKSKFGISTPEHDIHLVRQRYQEAVALDAARQALQSKDSAR